MFPLQRSKGGTAECSAEEAKVKGKSFGVWLKGQLSKRDWNRDDLVVKMQGQVGISCINKLCAGGRVPHRTTLEKIEEALGEKWSRK